MAKCPLCDNRLRFNMLTRLLGNSQNVACDNCEAKLRLNVWSFVALVAGIMVFLPALMWLVKIGLVDSAFFGDITSPADNYYSGYNMFEKSVTYVVYALWCFCWFKIWESALARLEVAGTPKKPLNIPRPLPEILAVLLIGILIALIGSIVWFSFHGMDGIVKEKPVFASDMRPVDWLLFFGIFAGCAVFTWVYTFLTTFATRRQLQKLAGSLGGRMGNSIMGEPVLELEHRGFPVRIYVTRQERDIGSFLRVVFITGYFFKLKVVPAQSLELLDRVVSFSFLNRVETGFPDVDEKLLFYSAQENLVRVYLSDESVRKAMIALFDEGWTELVFGGNKVRASRLLFDEDTFGLVRRAEDLDEKLLKSTLEIMSVLSNSS